jgi:hypothetical protein
MNFSFHSVDEFFAPPTTNLLDDLCWKTQPFNAPFLAGKGPEEPRVYGPLNGKRPPNTEITEEDEMKIVGKIDDLLSPETATFIIATTSHLQEAIDTAALLGYRPALAGEFLQILLMIQKSGKMSDVRGYFYCWSGRVDGYAIFAEAERSRNAWMVTFDTQLDDLTYVSANMEVNCFFVKE